MKAFSLKLNLLSIDNNNVTQTKTLSFFLLLTVDYQTNLYFWIIIEYYIIFLLLLISQVISDLNEITRRLCLFLTFALLFGINQKFKPFVQKIHTVMNLCSISVILVTITFEMVGNSNKNEGVIVLFARIVVMGANAFFFAVCGFLITRILYKSKREEIKAIAQTKKSKFQPSFYRENM